MKEFYTREEVRKMVNYLMQESYDEPLTEEEIRDIIREEIKVVQAHPNDLGWLKELGKKHKVDFGGGQVYQPKSNLSLRKKSKLSLQKKRGKVILYQVHPNDYHWVKELSKKTNVVWHDGTPFT